MVRFVFADADDGCSYFGRLFDCSQAFFRGRLLVVCDLLCFVEWLDEFYVGARENIIIPPEALSDT
jgi:hypothetical protein